MDSERELKCFVPNCSNRQLINERGPLQFFPVPDGIEQLFWIKAVKLGHGNYDKLIGFLSGADSTLSDESSKPKLSKAKGKSSKRKSSRQKAKSLPREQKLYCCEAHFDIDTEIDRILNENGSVEYKVKPGAVPEIKPRQNKRLCDIYRNPDDTEDFDMNNEIVKSEESIMDVVIGSNNFEEINDPPTKISDETREVFPIKNYVSIVDISTLTYQKNTIPHQLCYEVTTLDGQTTSDESDDELIIPMSPLTTALMKRKSMYYMGQERKRFLRLLQLASQRTQLSDVKVMITLRKLQLNEEFEALGDLFDLDKTTAEQYFHESKHLVIGLVDMLSSTSQANTNNIQMSLEPMIKVEDDRSSSSESSATYYGSEDDPDVNSEDFDTDSSCDNVSRISADEKTYECSICKTLYSSRGLEMHMERSHLNHQNMNKTTCGLCWQTFDTHSLLKAHQKDVHGGCAYECDSCGKLFVTKRSSERHILTIHAKLQTFLCDTCGVGFATKGDLSCHIRMKHKKIREKECHLCDKKYFDKATLDAHILAVHTNERPFKCKVEGCSKTFNRINCYGTHKRVHAADKFVCKMCSKEFSFKANLHTHLKNIHGQMHIAT